MVGQRPGTAALADDDWAMVRECPRGVFVPYGAGRHLRHQAVRGEDVVELRRTTRGAVGIGVDRKERDPLLESGGRLHWHRSAVMSAPAATVGSPPGSSHGTLNVVATFIIVVRSVRWLAIVFSPMGRESP